MRDVPLIRTALEDAAVVARLLDMGAALDADDMEFLTRARENIRRARVALGAEAVR